MPSADHAAGECFRDLVLRLRGRSGLTQREIATRIGVARSGQPLATLHGHTGGVWGVALSGDNRLIVSGSYDGTIRLWERASGRELVTIKGTTP